MRAFILVSCLAVLASARPEPPSGYQYNRPTGGGGGGNLGLSSNNFGSTAQLGYSSQVPSIQFNDGGLGASSNNNFGQIGLGSSNNGFSTGFNPGPAVQQQYQQQQQQQYQPQPQQTVVQKHIYVHVPPPEQEEAFHQQNYPAIAPQKHYKIIFIKTPSAPSYAQQQIQLAAQNEEKTLVYVLVKKPDAPEDIVFQQPAPIQPSKPEVYFIKYKTQKGQSNLGGASSNLGGSIANLPIQSGPNLGSFGSASSGSQSFLNNAPIATPAAKYGPPGGPY